ncbi:Clp protease N-terminal domain-containing protein [Kribbella kalugense]|uniref:ClpA/ClpB-like protein n=1 Tax=Kribbella kalugense TaxID=2512221 RepID=A0A4R7ZLE7_9ACTN|nr:Clp protease N-terminal domain-containing protein [Kribbella kalugense]TDW16000.1 ClpA/ClpB-like protein [Kribbella kalugense]
MSTDVRSILVRAARDEARRDGSRTIEAEHVLLALAGMRESSAAQLLTEEGLSEEAIRTALNREWEQSLAVAGIAVRMGLLPEATPDRGHDPHIGESTKLLLKRAMDAPPKLGPGRIGPMRILVGLLDTDRGRVARTLDAAGVDRATLHTKAREALASGNR